MKLIRLTVGPMDNNCYIIRSDKGNGFIIDPGAESEKILEAIRANEVTLKAILLTHGHFDHIGAVRDLIEATGAGIIVSKEDEEMLYDPVKNVGARFADDLRYNLSGLRVERTVSHGDRLELDELTLTVFATPGHTLGSVVYILGDMLFTGDTLFAGTIGIVTHYGGDLQTEVASVKRLADELEGDYRVLPGHDRETTLETERRTNPYLGNVDYDDCY